MSFADLGLRTSSLKMLEAQGITTPTPIQSETIPLLMAGRDVIGQAHTGSGKTLAFGLPLIESCDAAANGPQALVLTPTRELAQQVGNVLQALAGAARLSLTVLHGGVGYGGQMEALERGAHIAVGTPGRVLDHLQRGTLNLAALRLLVLDEADQMLDQGFAPDVERIIARTPRSRQTALFSATTPEWVRKVSQRHMRAPEYVRVGGETEAAPEIEHSVIEVWSGDKLPVLVSLLSRETGGATLVFGRTRHGVINLARRLQRLGFEVEALQGDLSQQSRDRIVKRFREGRLPVLMATNVAARGLDMLNIDRVINYDIPDTSELFVHRVGRTGRMGRMGEAITLVAATDLQKLHEIERGLGRKLPRLNPPAAVSVTPVSPPRPPTPEFSAASPASADEKSKPRRRRRRPRRGKQASGGLVAAASV